MTPEGKIQAAIQLALSESGCVVFRNETAGCWTGKAVARTSKGDQVLRHAKPMQAGLCTGSSDLIGWTPTGRFLAVEVKTPTGRPTVEQRNFIDRVRAAGGCAGICRSTEDALQLVAPYLQE